MTFKNVSYRKKNKLLWVLFLLVLILCYKLSISKTVHEFKILKSNRLNTLLASSTDSSIKAATLKNTSIDILLNKYMLDSLDVNKNLIAAIGEFCEENEIRINEYSPQDVTSNDSIRVFTRTVTVEGKFIPCLKLINYLETKASAGRVASVLFRTVESNSNSAPALHCSIYLQNLTNKVNEN